MSFPALMEELAGEAGLGSKFLCVCEGFQALHRSQDKLLGLAPQCTRGSTQCFKHLKYTVSRNCEYTSCAGSKGLGGNQEHAWTGAD